MTKITQKKLIESLSQLKEIKPRADWASLLKSQILAEKKTEPVKANFVVRNFIRNLKLEIGNSFSRKLAYSFAAILLLIIGAVGFDRLPAALTVQTPLVVDLNTKINDLAIATKSGSDDINIKVSALAQSLKNTSVKDPQTMKQIAKTLADVPGTDLTANQDPDVKDLYQTVVQNQITDLQKTTLTENQKNILKQAEELYAQGKYADALILLMGNN